MSGELRTILVVEDERNDVFFLEYAFQGAGITNPLQAVADGQEAIDYLAGQGAFSDRKQYPLPCLLLLDLNMPGKSGFDVLRWIRQQPNLKSLKVVVVSGSNQEADMATARSLGITDYIIKPSGLHTLLEIIQEKKDVWLPKEN